MTKKDAFGLMNRVALVIDSCFRTFSIHGKVHSWLAMEHIRSFIPSVFEKRNENFSFFNRLGSVDYLTYKFTHVSKHNTYKYIMVM